MRKFATGSIVVVALLEWALAWLAMASWQNQGASLIGFGPSDALTATTPALNIGFMHFLLGAALLAALVYSSRNTVRVLLMMTIATGVMAGFTLAPIFFAVQAAPAFVSWVLVRMTSPA
ncbi:MAG: hypothetical protein AAFY04_03925 [Pseudomonadota bacterium]